MMINAERPTICTRKHMLYVCSTSSAPRVTVLVVRERGVPESRSNQVLELASDPGLAIRPYQFDVLFHEYADSIFCQFES